MSRLLRRPRLSVSRSPTPRAVSPPRHKWNKPKSLFLFWWDSRCTRSGFLYGDTISLAITKFKDCPWHVRLGLGHSAGRYTARELFSEMTTKIAKIPFFQVHIGRSICRFLSDLDLMHRHQRQHCRYPLTSVTLKSPSSLIAVLFLCFSASYSPSSN